MIRALKKIVFVSGILAVTVCSSIAFADPKEMLLEKDWGAYRYDDNAGRMCFVSSVPVESKGKYEFFYK